MVRTRLLVLSLSACALLPARARADAVGEADVLLCAAVEVTRCAPGDGCKTSPPWDLDVPQFIEVDVARKELRTTEASQLNRMTPIDRVERHEGAIFLQGVELGRAFSFVITEDTGDATVTVAHDGFTVNVFGTCTPLTKVTGQPSAPGSSR